MAENVNIAVLVESKQEYTQKMIDVIAPHMYRDFYDMFKEGSDVLEKMHNRTPKDIFTLVLKNVSKWQEDPTIVKTYTLRLLTECSWLMDLLKTIMVLNTMVLAAIRDNQHSARVNVELPESEVFVYALYKQVAKKMSPNVFVHFYSDDEEKIEKAEEKMMSVIEKSIKQVILELLPMKHLIAEYMNGWGSNQFTCDDKLSASHAPPSEPDPPTPSPTPDPPPSSPTPDPPPSSPTPVEDTPPLEESVVTASPPPPESVEKPTMIDNASDDSDGVTSDDDDVVTSSDEEDSEAEYTRLLQERAKAINRKMRRMKVTDKKTKKRVPGKMSIPFDSSVGEERKTVKISSDAYTPSKPSEYLGNDEFYDD